MYILRHSLRLLVLLLTLSLGVGGQLFGQYYPVHATIQWPFRRGVQRGAEARACGLAEEGPLLARGTNQ